MRIFLFLFITWCRYVLEQKALSFFSSFFYHLTYKNLFKCAARTTTSLPLQDVYHFLVFILHYFRLFLNLRSKYLDWSGFSRNCMVCLKKDATTRYETQRSCFVSPPSYRIACHFTLHIFIEHLPMTRVRLRLQTNSLICSFTVDLKNI